MRKMHNLGSVSITALSDFVLLSELGSFQRTAEQRGISQPALSRRVQTLEASVGAPLIDRRTQPVRLTRAGRALLPFVKDSLQRLSDGAEFFKGAVSGLTDPLTFVATHTLATCFFPEWVRSVGICLSRIEVVLNAFRTERCVTELEEGRADLGLCLAPKSVQLCLSLLSKVIDSDELVPVISPEFRLRKGVYPFLSYAPGSPLATAVQDATGSLPSRITAPSVFESPSSEVLKSMTLAGHGASYLPRMLVGRELRLRQLHALPTPWRKIPLSVTLIRGRTSSSTTVDSVWSRLLL